MSYYHCEKLKRFLTVKEVAEELNVSVDTVYKLIESGKITAHKVSKMSEPIYFVIQK